MWPRSGPSRVQLRPPVSGWFKSAGPENLADDAAPTLSTGPPVDVGLQRDLERLVPKRSALLLISVVATKWRSAWKPPCSFGHPARSRHFTHSLDRVRSVNGLPRVVVNSNATGRFRGSVPVVSSIMTSMRET